MKYLGATPAAVQDIITKNEYDALDLRLYAREYPNVNNQTGNYTLVASDQYGIVIQAAGTGVHTFTIPPSVHVIGAQIAVFLLGTGSVVIAPGAGVTLESNGLELEERYSSMVLRQRYANGWVVERRGESAAPIMAHDGTSYERTEGKVHFQANGDPAPTGLVTGDIVIVEDPGPASTAGNLVVVPIDNTDSPYSASAGELVVVDSSSGAVTVALPPAAAGKVVHVKRTTTGSSVTVDGDSAETIDGTATAVLTAQWEAVTFASTATEWLII